MERIIASIITLIAAFTVIIPLLLKEYLKNKEKIYEHDKKLTTDFLEIASLEDYNNALREFGMCRVTIDIPNCFFSVKCDQIFGFCQQPQNKYQNQRTQKAFLSFSQSLRTMVMNYVETSSPDPKNRFQCLFRPENYILRSQYVEKHLNLLTECRASYEFFCNELNRQGYI